MKKLPVWTPDRGEWLAVAVGLAVAAAASGVLFAAVGWLGVGLVGLIGLVISGRVALHDGRAVPEFNFGSSDVELLARQLEEERRMLPEQQAAHRAEQDRRRAIVRFMNAICLAITALGLAMFVLHQL